MKTQVAVLTLGALFSLAGVLAMVEPGIAGTLPEYPAAEARKHIGKTATVVGRVDCISYGRRHTDVQIGGCDLRKALLWIVVPNEVSGPELEPRQLRGVTIAVTGKVESSAGTPQITIKSTTQIIPRTQLNPDYFSSAMEKQSRGDLDGAISDLDRVVELTHERSMYMQRIDARLKKGDLDGAIHDYDDLIERSGNETPVVRSLYYDGRAGLKIKKGDYDGAIADADVGIRLNPIARLFSTRGDAYSAKGDFERAAADYQTAVNNDPPGFMYKDKLNKAKDQAARQKPAADSSAAQTSTSQPTSAEVVDIPPAQANFGIKAGNIKVTFAHGHAEAITKNGNCMEPHVSAKGDVGWIQCTGFDRKGYALNEKLIIRSAKGDQREFKPDPKAPFIGAWTFVDDDSAIVIQSRSFHGPASFIRYDLVTGKVTNKKDGRDDSEPPPKWAQPLST